MIRTLLTVAEVAKRMKVQPQQVHRYIKDRRLRAERYGIQFLINEEDYERFIPTRQKPGHPKVAK
jgi:excisionase family DNA binding protein